MTGAIPPYGTHFVRADAEGWDRYYNSTLYRWRGNLDYYLRSDKTSKKWYVFRGSLRISEQPYPSLTTAMVGFLEVVKALRLTDRRTT